MCTALKIIQSTICKISKAKNSKTVLISVIAILILCYTMCATVDKWFFFSFDFFFSVLVFTVLGSRIILFVLLKLLEIHKYDRITQIYNCNSDWKMPYRLPLVDFPNILNKHHSRNSYIEHKIFLLLFIKLTTEFTI